MFYRKGRTYGKYKLMTNRELIEAYVLAENQTELDLVGAVLYTRSMWNTSY